MVIPPEVVLLLRIVQLSCFCFVFLKLRIILTSFLLSHLVPNSSNILPLTLIQMHDLFLVVVTDICVFIPRYMNTTCLVHTMLAVFFQDEHLALDSKLVCSFLLLFSCLFVYLFPGIFSSRTNTPCFFNNMQIFPRILCTLPSFVLIYFCFLVKIIINNTYNTQADNFFKLM